jgi:hypothetical protein
MSKRHTQEIEDADTALLDCKLVLWLQLSSSSLGHSPRTPAQDCHHHQWAGSTRVRQLCV